MEQSAKLTPRELLFCGQYIRLGDAAEAARQAGFPEKQAGQTAVQLLDREDVQQQLDHLRASMRQQIETEALAGLRRLALGPRNDAAYLATSREMSRKDLDKLDLFGVAEIKQAKDGGCDVKFIDRLPALTLLLEYGRSSQDNQPGSLLDALEQSARALAAGSAHHDL